MNKIKLVLYNILSFIIFFLILEGISYVVFFYSSKEYLNINSFKELKYHLPQFINKDDYYTAFINKHSKKRPITFFGDSYVYDSDVGEKSSLAYKTYSLTGRSVYSRAIPGSGIQFTALDDFETGKMKKDIPDTEYIIYVFLSYHLENLYNYQIEPFYTIINQRYKIDNGVLKKIKQPKFPVYNSLFITKNIQKFVKCYNVRSEIYFFVLFNTIMEKVLAESKKLYKDVKFIIIEYPSVDVMNDNDMKLPKYEIQNLEKMGFIVIDAEKLTDKPIRNKEYRTDDGMPTEDALNLIVPELIKKINL